MNDRPVLRYVLPVLAAILVAAALFGAVISGQTPVGSVAGKAFAQESGNPLEANITLTAKDTTGETYDTYEATCDVEGRFKFTRIPTGWYTLSATTRAHHLDKLQVHVTEGKTERLEVELLPDPPRLELMVNQHVYTPGEKPQIICDGLSDALAVDISIYAVKEEAVMSSLSGSALRNILGNAIGRYDDDGRRRFHPQLLASNASLTSVSDQSTTIARRDKEGLFTQRVNLPAMQPGLYVLGAVAGEAKAIDWILVTDIGLVSKQSHDSVFVYTADLKTGAPLSGVEVSVYDEYGKSKLPSQATTGADGTAGISMTSLKSREGRWSVLARRGKSFAIVSSWFSGGSSGGGYTIYAYTERPVYRPGQRVFFKGVVRKNGPTGYQNAPGKSVTVEVQDAQNTLIHKDTGKTDDYGSYHGSFSLTPESASGSYTLVTTIDGEGRQDVANFDVASYRKPEFEVKVEMPKKRCVRGERIRAKVSATYYFGSPVANGKLSYSILRDNYYLFGADEEDIDYPGASEEFSGGESIDDGDIRLDENGEAVVEFDATWDTPKESEYWDSDQKFTVDAYVSDAAGSYADSSASITATRGTFDLRMDLSSWVVAPGGQVRVNLRAMDYDNKPVANQAIDVFTAKEVYDDLGKSQLQEQQRGQVRTDSMGRASWTFTAWRSGDVSVVATAVDSVGNKIARRDYVWCYSEAEPEAAGAPLSDIQIVTDKKTYNPGDTATVLVTAKAAGASVLVSLEGERVYQHQTVKLGKGPAAVHFKISEEYRPNFYVSACYVKNKDFKSTEVNRKVSIASKQMAVEVKPDKQVYEPGEQVTYSIRTTANGKPVRAQFSLGVVDEAIYAIRAEKADPILDYFYAHRPNSVRTNFSFPEIYLSDEEKDRGPTKELPRTKFKDTAYWLPIGVTDANGRATASFTLPDNLTKWRATVRAIDRSTVCGQSVNSITARKELMVQVMAPRFLVQADRTTIRVSVHNDTGSSGRFSVQLMAEGGSLDGKSSQQVTVANGQAETIEWGLSSSQVGNLKLTASARGANKYDGMVVTLPVIPHGVERETTKVGSMSGDGKEEIVLQSRANAVKQAGHLSIELTPSLAGSLLGSLDYLATYPYGCVEQTTSSFIPDVVLWKASKDLGVRLPISGENLPDMVRAGLDRLYRMQMPDGQWGWCEYGQGDIWMTAYVCYGLLQAREAGFPVNPRKLESGLNWLSQNVMQGKRRTSDRLFALYVLALGREYVTEKLAKVRAYESSFDAKSRALLALTLHEMSKDPRYAQASFEPESRRALANLFGVASNESGMIGWKEGDWHWSEGVESTALGLLAAVRIAPNDTRIPSIVRYLMNRKQGDHWYSTRDTALTLYAMTEYLRTTKELQPDYTLSLTLNGKPFNTIKMDAAAISDPVKRIHIPGAQLADDFNRIGITKMGQGNLYWSASLTQFVSRDDEIAKSRSTTQLNVRRAYYASSKDIRAYHEESELGRKLDSADEGDIILVRLVIDSKQRFEHLMLEDYVPAGCEIVDRGEVDYYDWNYWYVSKDIRDSKMSFYLDTLSPGTHVIEYRMRASIRGSYAALPAQVFGMYIPSLRAATGEQGFVVK